MAFEYKHLTPANQEQMLNSRIAQFEQEHFNHEMNKAAVAALPDSDPGKADALKQANDAQAIIETAIAVANDQLAIIAAETAPTSPTPA